MRRITRYFVSTLFAATLAVPAGTQIGMLAAKPAAARVDDNKHVHRYYDKHHKDYHEWNEAEERAYRHYLKEQRREYKDFARMNRHDRRQYWEWRHAHPGELD